MMLDPWYVTGFVDGEGIFTYNRDRGRTRTAVVFAIRLVATDRAILESVRRFFGGSGRIYSAPKRAARRRAGFSKATCYFKVTRPAELLRIVDHFDRYPLQAQKRQVYDIWREMVFLRAAYHGGPQPAELDDLAAKLSATVPRNQPWG
jgi:hypothetical protein